LSDSIVILRFESNEEAQWFVEDLQAKAALQTVFVYPDRVDVRTTMYYTVVEVTVGEAHRLTV
jgi:hypothetical protein